MIYCLDLNLGDYLENIINQKTVKDREGVEFLNIEAGFDIETTSTDFYGEKFAAMYVWQFGIGHDNPVIYGRTWEELADLLTEISERLELCAGKRLVVYVHNLGYEFQFMRHYFQWGDIFAVAERKPLKALSTLGIEFRCSYILSGYSLANTAKNLTSVKVEKLVGDLDYSLIRHHETTLTDEELKYCENDIKIVTAYIKEQLAQYKKITYIPLTNTGRVRKYVRDSCYYVQGSHKKKSRSKWAKYRKIMADLTLTPKVYKHCKMAFQGGFTHANSNHVGKTLEAVDSIDITSSYPTVMLSEQYPMSRGKEVTVSSVSELKKLFNSHCVIMTVKLVDVENKLGYESYISESKCHTISKPTIVNGRVFSADELTTTITDVDFNIIEAVYSWSEILIADVIIFRKGYLPKDIAKSILNLYEKKTTLKDVDGYEVEYLLSKGMLNSVYGMSVTDVLQTEVEYNGEWRELSPDVESKIEDYNESKNRFLYYPWGVWVTAYARRNLWAAILNVGNDYIYADTDSVKMFNYEKHLPFVEKYNDWILKRLENALASQKIPTGLIAPKNQRGESKPLGIWEHEGHYRKFKTLGAKRYMYLEGDKFGLTVAGLSKQNGMNYMIEQCGGDEDKVFSMFDNSLYVPAARTGKMTHTYIDEDLEAVVTDYRGKPAKVLSLSGVHLENCEFTLSISEQFLKFISQLSKGYIYKGVKHI